LFRVVRRLVDPSATEVLALTHDVAGLVQQLSHHWLTPFDNVSDLPDHISDVLCRAVTGDGFSKRELYSNDDDVIYSFRRCVGLNGINIVARKPDLLDRCILFELEPIDPAHRLPDQMIWSDFERLQPRLFGAMLDVLSKAAGIRPAIRLGRLPRMADFAVWGCAVARALGVTEEEFLAAYDANQTARNEEAISASPVASALEGFMRTRNEWKGSPSELLSELEGVAEIEKIDTRAKGWPKGPHVLTRRLNEVRPNLAAAGISVERSRDSSSRCLVVRKHPVGSVIGVTSVIGGLENNHLSSEYTSGSASDGDATYDATDDATVGVRSKASADGEPLERGSQANDANDANDAIFFAPTGADNSGKLLGSDEIAERGSGLPYSCARCSEPVRLIDQGDGKMLHYCCSCGYRARVAVSDYGKLRLP